MKEKYWRYSLIVIILLMGVIIFRQITPFMGGLLGALTIYILVRGQMGYLLNKKNMKIQMLKIKIQFRIIDININIPQKIHRIMKVKVQLFTLIN